MLQILVKNILMYLVLSTITSGSISLLDGKRLSVLLFAYFQLIS